MDVLQFLQHTKFIRNFHDAAITPFERTQLKIWDQEAPTEMLSCRRTTRVYSSDGAKFCRLIELGVNQPTI